MSADEHGGIGHNSIRNYVDRAERLAAEIDGLKDDLADIFKEAASSTGLTKKSFKQMVAERRKDPGDVHSLAVEMDVIRRALGMRDPMTPPSPDA